MGRPKGETEGVRISLYFNAEVIKRADVLAKKAGMSRSRLVGNILDEGLRSLERADSYGVLAVAVLLRDFSEGLKSWANQVRDEGHQISEDHAAGEFALS